MAVFVGSIVGFLGGFITFRSIQKMVLNVLGIKPSSTFLNIILMFTPFIVLGILAFLYPASLLSCAVAMVTCLIVFSVKQRTKI
jgi:uncharacterized membrane protein